MKRVGITHVTKRNGERVPFDQERITFAIYKAAASVGGTNMRRARRLSDRVVLTIDDRFEEDEAPSVEAIQDLIEEVLITAGHVKTARSFIVYRENRRAARQRAGGTSRAAHGPTPYRTLWDTLAWNVTHDCYSVAGLNQAIRSGQIHQVIAESEMRFDAELEAVAQQLSEREGVRVVIVAGPSSSGKTTTTNRLSEKLARRGLSLTAINVDNYFRALEHQPRDERGDYDYETPEAIDLPLFNDHLEKLIAGRKVESPIFDFMTGERKQETLPMKLARNELVLIDTLHGMYKGLTAKIPEELKYKVYIEAVVQLMTPDDDWMKWTDLRLLRRMARDRIHRNKRPDQTLDHWHYVRRSEKKHIIPYVGDADFVLNGSFPYEVPLYKPLLFESLGPYLESAEATADGLERARRLHDLLAALDPLEDCPEIPGTSVVREFIGGAE